MYPRINKVCISTAQPGKRAHGSKSRKVMGRKKQGERRGVIKVKPRSHMGGGILNDSPCSKTSPTEGLNLSPSIHLPLSLPEMQLIRMERAKCAEMERDAPSHMPEGGPLCIPQNKY